MKLFIKFSLIILLILNVSCKNKDTNKLVIAEEELDVQMIQAYKEGLELLNRGDGLGASKKFSDAELLYPQSIWAPRSSLMSAYSLYSSMYFVDAVYEAERFLKVYPKHEREVYAHYLLAISYYDQIIDEKKDLNPLIKAKENFEIVINKYPNSDFAFDAKLKLAAIQEILASKEMYTAKYYFEREKWIPAINRYKNVINKYQTTIYVEEALHRLVEIHYIIGLEEEAKKYAVLLGYNYKSSEWYEESYKVFNRDYEKISIRKKNKNKKTILEKLRSLIQ
jgi:outer membrane protein assembly factor BamD